MNGDVLALSGAEREPIDVSRRLMRGELGEARADELLRALSHELNLAARIFEGPVRAQAAVAARHVWNASSRRTRSVRRDVRWRWTLKVFWTAA